jgi:outer membrane protein assembly factor BamB
MFQLSRAKAVPTWTVKHGDVASSPLIYHGYVYAVGGGVKATAICVKLDSGQVMWEQKIGHQEYSSPILADGKIYADDGNLLCMIRATPDKYERLGQTEVDVPTYPSPAIANGRIYLRTAHGIVCYDLRAQPSQSPTNN